MKNRAFTVILGAALVVLGLTGIFAFQMEIGNQNAELKALADEEGKKAREERNRAADLQARLEAEKKKIEDTRARLAAEEDLRKDEQAARRKVSEELQARKKREAEEKQKQLRLAEAPKSPPVKGGKSSARQAVPERKSEPREPAREQSAEKSRDGDQGPKPVTVRFDLYPGRQREIQVARVHAGDKVTIKVRRMQGADGRLYAGLAPLREYAYRGGPPFFDGEFDPGPAMSGIPLKDFTQFTVRPQPGPYGGRSGSKSGTMLRIGVDPFSMRFPPGASHRFETGYYRIEVIVQQGNKWDAEPKSMLERSRSLI